MHQSIRRALPLSLLVAALLLFTVPYEAAAQQQKNNQKNDLNLPAWSESQARQQQPARSLPQQNATDPPNDDGGGTPQVPLGGLEWLALAGGAYAVSRLRRRDDEGEADGAGDLL